MKVGVVGLGKVGLPLALVLQEHGGHDVMGYDVRHHQVVERLMDARDHGETGLGELIGKGSWLGMLAEDIDELVAHADVVFVVVQTLHGPGYGGETPMPTEPADFDYEHLTLALMDLELAAQSREKDLTVAVVSTVLPGTLRRLRPHLSSGRLRLVYNPALISLGTVVQDLIAPDFHLIGADSEEEDEREAAMQVAAVWRGAPALRGQIHLTSIASAELLKVALNAYLSQKIAFANTLAQLCHGIDGADVDEVTDGLKLSRKALGPFGLTAGMGDGGPCRPRDLIALHWLDQRLGMAVSPFRQLARKREGHAHWLAELVAKEARDRGLSVVVLGTAYKPGSQREDGSPARLLCYYLTELGVKLFPFDEGPPDPDRPLVGQQAVYVLAVPHAWFLDLRYPPGSVVIDPHGLVKDQDEVTVIRVGRR